MMVGAATTALPTGDAAAQGLLDFLFGRAPPPPPPQLRSYVPPDPVQRWDDQPPRETLQDSARERSAPYTAYCVRLCDGRYFPIQGHRNVSSAEMCSSFCPASQTRIFSGSGIEHAVSSSGQRYGELPNAFAYRKHFVAGCTCNGTTKTGLAHIAPQNDPTLRPGDIVATESGLMAYAGSERDRQAAFTPIAQARMPKREREHLAQIKIRPTLPTAGPARTQPDEPAETDPIDVLRGALSEVSR